MSIKNNGGPAFPVPNLEFDSEFNGMTLRDYFAAKAMASIISNTTWFDAITETASKALHVEGGVELSLEVKKMCADHAYGFADAMLKARETK